MNNEYPIDFVILWVDGSDEEWLEEKKKYKPNLEVANSVIRFRDWGNLKYWFRGVEKFAPWVNNIYFVTYRHLPKFLNVNHPKIKIVNHKDFMEERYLPTYNSNAIDINVGKIKDLNEHFVYFNDDVFIINKVSREDFFKNGLPVDEYAETPVVPDHKSIFPYTMFNNVYTVNNFYNKKEVYKKNKFKYLNFKYREKNLRTIMSKSYKRFLGFYSPHITQAFLKSYFAKAWELCENVCESTSMNKFRTKEDITQYLVRYFQLLDGNFEPRKYNFGKYLLISNDNTKIINTIEKQKCKIVCLNDASEDINFEKAKAEINAALEKILPEKSSFEI